MFTFVHVHTNSLEHRSPQFSLFSYPFRALAKVADILEPTGLQEEAELPAQILAEFVMVCTRWEPACQKPKSFC